MPIIAITSTKGGTGKTTTSYNLTFALKPHRVFDQDLHVSLRVLAQMRDTPLPFPLQHYEDVGALLDALRDAVTNGETVLVDVGGFDSDIARAVCAVADLIITPCNDTPTDRIGLARFDVMLEEVSKTTGAPVKAYVLMCKAHPSARRFKDIENDIAKSDHFERMKTIITNRPDHYRCHAQGIGVTERTATRHGAAGKEILALAEEIRELIAARV